MPAARTEKVLSRSSSDATNSLGSDAHVSRAASPICIKAIVSPASSWINNNNKHKQTKQKHLKLYIN